MRLSTGCVTRQCQSRVFTGTPIGTLFTAAKVNSNANTKENCTDAWVWTQILCDLTSTGGATPNGSNNTDYAFKSSANVGYTIDSDASTRAYVVIDLGAVRNFTTLRIFQMFSDGKTTEVAMSVSNLTSSTWPDYNDATWTSVVSRSPVGSGKDSSPFVTCPTILDFGATNGRYVRLDLWNGGQFGSPSWVEVTATKLFYENTVAPPGSGCPPEPPTNSAATAGNATASVSWTPPTGVVTGYSLQQSSNGGSTWTSAVTSPNPVTGSATSTLVTGLSNGTTYVFRVLASNATGSSPYSNASNAVTPSAGLPNPPTNVVATAGNALVDVSWTAVSGATSYQVTGSPSGSCSAVATATTCTVTGLTNGLTYTFTVTTTSSGGVSGASLPSNQATPTGPTHTVIFNANGGSGTMSNQVANVATNLTTNTFTRTGYSFSGWNTVAGGGGTAYADGASYAFAADVTLYAQWTALPNHTVTFNNNNGTGSMTAQVANVATNLTTNTFTRTGYSFSGWNTVAGGGGTAYADGASYAFAADVTLYAQWTAAVVNGACATVAATAFVPTTGLCTQGTAPSSATPGSPWTWTCTGSGGGSTASCSAPNASTATGTGTGRAVISGDTWVVDTANSAGFVATSTTPSLPPGYTFPHGLFELKIISGAAGSTATVVITWPAALPAGTQYWKYGPEASNHTPHWYQFAGAAISGNTITLTITDGGAGDDDYTANSVITDPGGPGVPDGSAAVGIPTLSEWSLIILAGLMGLFAMGQLRRARRR